MPTKDCFAETAKCCPSAGSHVSLNGSFLNEFFSKRDFLSERFFKSFMKTKKTSFEANRESFQKKNPEMGTAN